jgi:hypothetical protein
LPIHECFEKFPLFYIKVLHTLMIDIFETHDLTESDRKWYHLNCKSLSKLLEGGGESTNYFCSIEHLYVKVIYKQIKYNKNLHVGRLYAQKMCSYTYLPLEIRGILLDKNKIYRYFDIVNAHPTLLLEYVLHNMPNFSPKSLHSYVYHRDEFLNKKVR